MGRHSVPVASPTQPLVLCAAAAGPRSRHGLSIRIYWTAAEYRSLAARSEEGPGKDRSLRIAAWLEEHPDPPSTAPWPAWPLDRDEAFRLHWNFVRQRDRELHPGLSPSLFLCAVFPKQHLAEGFCRYCVGGGGSNCIPGAVVQPKS